MNARQVSRIDLSPEIVDCIVFWTKNPLPMLDKLDALKDYQYYFQFTLTGYGRDMEPGLPEKRKQMMDIFRRLSLQIGKERVVWRYDPIMFTDKYTAEYHIRAFRAIAEGLRGYTERVVISFLDLYAKTKKNMRGIKLTSLEEGIFFDFVSRLSAIAGENGMSIATCAEEIDLSPYGIGHSSCIDRELIEKITGCKIKAKKDRNQREVCGCVESIDAGTYHTCRNGCKYCYANDSEEKVRRSCKMYNPRSPILCGVITEEDKITERRVGSLREE